MKRQYFVQIDSYWQNAPDAFVGPFASRELAENAIAAHAAAVASAKIDRGVLPIVDVRNDVRVVDVAPTTAAMRAGMHVWNQIGTDIPRDTIALHDALAQAHMLA